MKSEPGHDDARRRSAPLRLIVWCQEYCNRVEPDPAEMPERYGAETTVSDLIGRRGLCAASAAADASIWW